MQKLQSWNVGSLVVEELNNLCQCHNMFWWIGGRIEPRIGW